MTEEDEGKERNLLLEKLLENYPMDEKFDLDELSDFFVGGGVNWDLIGYFTGLRKVRSLDASLDSKDVDYGELSVVEALLEKAGICVPTQKVHKIKNFFILVVRGNLGYGNVHKKGYVFARKEDAIAYFWGWVDNNFNPSDIIISTVTGYDSEIPRNASASEEKIVFADIPKESGFDWLEEGVFPIMPEGK